MVPSTPRGLLAGSKREHLLYLLGIHAQQSLPIDTLSAGQLVPFTGNTSTSQLLWRASSYPQFTLQFPARVLDTHKVLVHRKSKHEPQSSFMAGTYRQWSCLQLCQVCQSASSSLLTLFWDFSLSQQQEGRWPHVLCCYFYDILNFHLIQ